MNSISTIDESQRKAARVAGFAFLSAMAIVVLANYGISFRLSVPGSAVETARNIMAHETLFRLNIACNLLYLVNVGVLLTALYVILKPVNRNLALVATFCRLIVALMWGITALNMLGALRLLGDAAYLPVFKADQLQTLARLQLSSGYDAYYVGLPFWGLASTVCSYLWLKSRSGGCVEVEDGSRPSAKDGALIGGGKEAVAPRGGAAFDPAGGVGHDDEGGHVLVFGSQAISGPGAEARFAHENGARIH